MFRSMNKEKEFKKYHVHVYSHFRGYMNISEHLP